MLQNVTPTAAIAAVASATTRACRFPTEADMDRLPKLAKSVESDPKRTIAAPRQPAAGAYRRSLLPALVCVDPDDRDDACCICRPAHRPEN
jgi:hypothetical protein